MSHTSTFIMPSINTSHSSLYISHPFTMWVLLSSCGPHGHIIVGMFSSSRRLEHLILRSGKSKSITENRSFSFFDVTLGQCRYFCIQRSSFNGLNISLCCSSSTAYNSVSVSFTFLFCSSVVYPPTLFIHSTSSKSLPETFCIFSTMWN